MSNTDDVVPDYDPLFDDLDRANANEPDAAESDRDDEDDEDEENDENGDAGGGVGDNYDPDLEVDLEPDLDVEGQRGAAAPGGLPE